jgi:hypothetical protein
VCALKTKNVGERSLDKYSVEMTFTPLNSSALQFSSDHITPSWRTLTKEDLIHLVSGQLLAPSARDSQGDDRFFAIKLLPLPPEARSELLFDVGTLFLHLQGGSSNFDEAVVNIKRIEPR